MIRADLETPGPRSEQHLPSRLKGGRSGTSDGNLKEKKIDELKGSRRFKSLGFAPLPQTFWERSLFVKPRDREVVCHASAWNLDFKDDLRLKMCIEIRDEDFITIHHELGHNFYQRAYNHLPILFQEGANDGFHEAIGDTVALAITPEYLHKVGLLTSIPRSDDTALLLRRALDKVAFLPFGLMIDQWRWKVMDGSLKPSDYNRGWWELREKYQGVTAPVARSEKDFDPGAKYHVPANVPYTRYFLAHILQFQFYRALCNEAGYKGPLHRCTFYDNKQAGEKLKAMLEMGASRPWPEALKAMTGETRIDAQALLDYFAPLKVARCGERRGKCEPETRRTATLEAGNSFELMMQAELRTAADSGRGRGFRGLLQDGPRIRRGDRSSAFVRSGRFPENTGRRRSRTSCNCWLLPIMKSVCWLFSSWSSSTGAETRRGSRLSLSCIFPASPGSTTGIWWILPPSTSSAVTCTERTRRF